MSKHLFATLQPATQCQQRFVRKCAPRAYLFRNDDHSPSRPRRPSLLHHPRARLFSTSPPCAASQVRQVKPSQQSQPSQPSIRAQMDRMQKKAMRSGELPDDLGLLPDTFIMPPAERRPGWLLNRKDRWKLEKARWIARFNDFKSSVGFKFSMKPRPKFQFRSLAGIAKELHKEMFANFATGELSTIQQKLCSGLLTSLRSRIAQRPPNTSYIWKLHQYASPPRLMSYKATVFQETMQLPSDERHGIEQAVVRIHSLQSLWPVKRVPVKDGNKTVMKDVIFDPHGFEHPPERIMESSNGMNQKETVEYFIIQRMYKRAQPGPWMVWGMAEETNLGKLEKVEQERKTGQVRQEAEKSQVGA